MAENRLLPENIKVIGVARKKFTREQFLEFVDQALHKENVHHKHQIRQDILQKLSEKLHYMEGSLDDPNFYPKLNKFIDQISKRGNRIYYLATYPELYHHIFENLQKQGMNRQKNNWVRLMIEKPIGHDLKSAQDLNHLLLNYFSEDQIYRLDHYLGKETLQNILTFRFANGIFEPIINKDYIDHIQITASEDFGIGARGGYSDTVGALKDVGQNHLLQMLAFATMDEPDEFTNKAVTKERTKILKNLIPYPNKLVLGQYKGYTKEDFEKLLKALSEIKGKFLLSSYPSELILKYSKMQGILLL